MRRRRRRLSPEEDALEHIVACTDKPFLEERYIDTSKGRGVFTQESIEPNTFVVEYRGNIFSLKELSKEKCGDTLNNYLFEFLWNDEYWCIDASKEDETFGRLVNDEHRNPNCKLRKIIYEGKPHLCLFALKKIYPGDEITFDYGESSYPWRSNNSSDEEVASRTDGNSSSSSKCSQEKCSTSQESCSEVSQPEGAFHNQEEDKTSSSSEDAESDGDYTPDEASTKSKKHGCYVCGKTVLRLAHHFFTHREEEAEIAELYCLPPHSNERKKLFQKLQDRGNVKHQRSESDSGEMTFTTQLKSSAALNADVVVHSQKTGDAQKVTPGVEGMLVRMKQDEITFAVQNDPLLLQLAQSLYDNYENTADCANHDFTTNTLREMGTLLLILRKKSVFCFADAVKPNNFSKVVEAVKDFSGFSKVTQTYKNPAVAQKLGNLVRKLGELVLSKAGNDEQLRSDMETFIKLCTQWQQVVSQASTSKLNGSKLNNPSTIPFIHDVQLFYKCLETTLVSAVESLKTHEAPCFYNALASVTVAQVSVLNKCASEVSEMTLKSFEEKETTQVLSKHFIRASIGKTKQKDSVLLTTELVDAITLLINKRETCGVHEENAFLFAKPDFNATSFYQGNACISIFASQCGAAKPVYLRAKEFYKHITRIFQILNLENDELDQLANLLGHNIQSKKEYYRLPEAAADIAKISKLLLSKEKGSLERTQGQSLSEVEFVGELEPDIEQTNFENHDAEEETKEETGCSDVAKWEERHLTPEEDALEHITACRDKPFLEERFIDFSKGRGVFTLETIEPNTFVVEYRGNIISHTETHETSFADTLNNYIFDFSWNGTKWCIDASKEDGSLGRLVNDDHISPNCTMKKIVSDGKPHLCLFAVKQLSPGEEITYNYGESSYLWRSRESNEGPSTSQTNQTEIASSQLNKKQSSDEPSTSQTNQTKTASSQVNIKVDMEAPISAECSAVKDRLRNSGPVHAEKSVKLNNPRCRSGKNHVDSPKTDSSKVKAFVSQSKDESCIQQDDDSDSSWDDCSSDEDYTPHQFEISPRSKCNRGINFCYVCGKRMKKVAQHLRTHKEEEPDIARAFASNNVIERKKLFEALRVKGNSKKRYQDGLSGKMNAAKIAPSVNAPSVNTSSVPLAKCLYCKGTYIEKTLTIHMQQCRSRLNFMCQPTGKSMITNIPAIPKSVCLQVIPSHMEKLLVQLKDAEIASLIKKDFLMLQLAEFMYQKRRNQLKDEYIRQKLKDMGRLLLTLRKKSVFSLEEAVKPGNFVKLVEAVRELVGFNEKERTWHRPHFLLKLVNSLKMIGDIMLNMALGNDAKQRTEEAHTFLKLCAKEWGLGRPETKLINPFTIPFTQDVQRLYLHLEDAFRAAVKYLQLYQNPQVYVALAKVTHAQVSIFNKRPSDVSELTVKAFKERQETETHQDASVHQSEFDKVLSNHFVTVNFSSTDGKKVELFLTSELISAMKLLVEKRDACEIHKDNPFLFAKLTVKYQSFYGQESIMDFATRCGAKNPEYLRSVHFLKHIARVFKILKLVNNDLPHLATLLGVELQLEKQYYRLPEAAVDIAKISQLLLTAEHGSLKRFRGKSLDQIEIADKLHPDVDRDGPEEITTKTQEKASISSPFQPGSSSPQTSLLGKCDTGATTQLPKFTTTLNSDKKNEVNKEKSDRLETLEDDDYDDGGGDNMEDDTNEEDGDSNHSTVTALTIAVRAQRESRGKHIRQRTSKAGPCNKPSTSTAITENSSKGPRRTSSNETVNEAAQKKDERKNCKSVKDSSLSVQLSAESNTPALMGLKDLKILIPKLDIRNLQMPIHTSQFASLVPADSLSQSSHGKTKNHLKRTASTGVQNQSHRTMVSEMSCPHCKKSIIRGQTAYQKRGYPQVFCSKSCLFVVFPARKGVTKTCHYCLKLIMQPHKLVVASVDRKGTMKNFCNQSCLSSFKSNTGFPCSICSKGIASREVTLNGVVYKFCSKSCLDLLSKKSKTSKVICANCSIICHIKPLTLKVEQGIKNICREECLTKFKQKLKSPQQCTNCHTSGFISNMVESKSSEGVIELFCTSSCVTAYKSQIDSSGGSPASSDQLMSKLTVAKSKLAIHASERDLPSELDATHTVSTASSSTACLHCKKKLDKGQTVHQTKNSQHVFCSYTCFSAHHLHVKLVTKKCYNCNQNILQANTIILAPVDDTGIMKELCSEACLSSVSFKMNTKYLQTVIPWSQCKRCKRFHFCKYKLIVDGTVLRICNDTCLMEYSNTHNFPLLCCDNCSALSNKPLTVKLRAGTKTICTAECLAKLKEKTVTPQLCAMCQTPHLMSDMVEDDKIRGELDFFCSNRCMMVYKTQSGKNTPPSLNGANGVNLPASSLDFVNDEPLEYRQDIYSSMFSDDITCASNMAQEEQCASVLMENSASAHPEKQNSNKEPETSNQEPETSNKENEASNNEMEASNNKVETSNNEMEASNNKVETSNNEMEASNKVETSNNEMEASNKVETSNNGMEASNKVETSNNEMETSNNEMETSNNETQTAETVTRMTFHKSCSHCKKVLVDGQSVYQRKGDISLFCSTSCISIYDQVRPVKKNCDFCFQAFKQSESIIQASADDGKMKNFCSQTCRGSFTYKRIMSSKMPPAAPHSICSICNICTRYCISKHEVIFHDIVHKICSDPCLSRFYKMNNLATCENCESRCHNPLTLNIGENNKAFCNEVCLAEFKQKIKTPQPCSGCCTPHPMSEMIENKNSDNVIKLFCNDGCVMASKIQAVIESDASLNCDNCGKSTLPVCHLTMSDSSIKNFCSLSCAMTFKETEKQIDDPSNTSKSPSKVVGDEILGDLQKMPEKLTCSQCGRTVKTIPKIIQLKDKMVFVCGLSCSDEFKRWNNITRKCEFCKKERIIKDSKRVNNIDRHFCSNRCKLFFERGLKKKWGKHCQTCDYCFRSSKTIVTSKYRGRTFCSNECSSKYNLLVRHHAKCDACGSEGKLMRSLPMLGEVKRFCDVKCLLQFCISKAQFNSKDEHSASDSAVDEEPAQATNNIVLLASTLNSQLAASSSTAQQGAVCGMEAKVTEQASTQTVAENVPCPPIPKVLVNKALLCMSLVHNKGVSCTKQAVDRQTQTDLGPATTPVPVPLPVYVPMPMSMYSQFTPKPVGLPVPIPVPIFLTAISDRSEPAKETIRDTAQPDTVNAEVDLKSNMVTKQDKNEEETEEDDGDELNEYQENSDDHTIITTNDMDTQESIIKNQEDPALDTSLPSSPHSNNKVPQAMDISMGIPMEPTLLSPPPAMEEKTQPSHTLLNLPPVLAQVQATKKVQSRQKGRKVPQGSKVETFHKTTKETMSVIPQTLNSQYAMNVWKSWMQWRHSHPSLGPLSSVLMEVKRDILLCASDSLRCALNYFINEVKHPNGQRYSPDGLFYLCLGIQQYLFENGRMENIFSDMIYYEFTVEFTRVLKTFSPQVTAIGCIRSCVEEEFLWDCKQLGAYSPIVLLNTLLFFCCKYFDFSTVKQQRQLSFARMKLYTKTNWNNTRTTFLRFYLPKSNNTETETDADGVPAKKRKKSENEGQFMEIIENTENPLRCPVRLYEFYLSKCLESMKQRTDVFYLHPVNSCSPRSPVWFSSTPLDDNTIDAVLIRFLTIRKMKSSKPGRSSKKQQRASEASVIPEQEN